MLTQTASPDVAVRPAQVTRKTGSDAPVKSADRSAFERITPRTKLGLYRYPFLDPLASLWVIVSALLNPKTMANVLSMLKHFASLAWLKDDKVVAIHVPGLSPTALLEKLRIGISLKGGLGKVSKRLSRIFRPYALFLWTTEADFRIRLVQRGPVRQSTQDGGYRISRHLLRQMVARRIKVEFKDALKSNDKREIEHARRAIANLKYQANHAMRVEITVMTREGQWKGHALVVESKKADIWLIEGQVKRDVFMTTDDVFVGVNVVHTSKLFLDQQSLTNLDVNGFFRTDPQQVGNRLVRWTQEYLHAYVTALREGSFVQKIVEQADAIEYREDADKFLSYWLFNVIARGGDPRWFGFWTKAFLQLGLKHLEARLNGRISLPLPGLNLYVFPGSIGNRKVKRGHCIIDVPHATIWVNDVDMVTLDPRFATVYDLQHLLETHDAAALEPGLQRIWGGSDCDDMMRVFQFVDVVDGIRKCLIWRSPNKLGEFAVLKFQVGDDLPWIDGSTWQSADSRLLPQPAQWQTKYLNLIKDYEGEKPTTYGLGTVWHMAKRMADSMGALGMYCLEMRFEVSTRGRLPDEMPCTVEQVTDAQVKDFQDTSAVKDFVRQAAVRLAESGLGIARTFAGEFQRFLGDEDAPTFKVAQRHWIDETVDGVIAAIEAYQAQIQHEADQARPPLELYTIGRQWIDAGRELRHVWNRTWRELLGDQPESEDAFAFQMIEDANDVLTDEEQAERRERQHDLVRAACQSFLERFDVADWPKVMVGYLCDVYTRWSVIDDEAFKTEDQHLRDSACWQLGAAHPTVGPEGRVYKNREAGFDVLTLQGLEDIGLLGHIEFDPVEHHLIIKTQPDTKACSTIILAARGVWFNLAKAQGWTRAKFMGEVDQHQKDRFKQAAAHMNLTGKEFELDIVEIQARKGKLEVPAMFSVTTGNLLGTLGQHTDLDTLPARVRVLSNHTDDRDVLWLICVASAATMSDALNG